MNPPLPWHDHASLLGIGVRVYFFDPDTVAAQADAALRAVPILAAAAGAPAGERPALLAGGDAGPVQVRAGRLQAQADLVLRHGDGLISVLTARGHDQRWHEPAYWLARLPADRVLQAVATAMAVAGQHQRPTAAVWRAPNALYQFDASLSVLEFLAGELPAAARWWQADGPVSAVQLASFCEPRLRAMLGAGRRSTPAPA